MKKGFIIIALVVMVALTGCAEAAATPAVPDSAPVMVDTPPDNVNWISPGKIEIGRYYPGARAEYPITIHNGNDSEAGFTVRYRLPDRPLDGYSPAPPEAQEWVTITESSPEFSSGESRDVLIILEMPKKATCESKKWEFWISVMQESRSMIQTELCQRWMVSMR